MYTHMVVCEPREIRAFNVMRNKSAGVEHNGHIAYATSWVERRVESDPDYNTLTNIDIVYAESEAAAKDVARIMAVAHPNKNVYVAKTIAMMLSKPTPPIESTVSEKGVVPK